MLQSTKACAIFGGTFDPIHLGHLHIAKHLYQQLPLQEVRFLPCKQPVLKAAANATSEQRLAMLRLAIASEPGLTIDDRELMRETPSYMVETLKSLRQELNDTPLCLILGYDAFASLPQWHQWQRLLDLSHLIVINRPGYGMPEDEVLKKLVDKHQIDSADDLLQKPAGFIFFQQLPPSAISSTEIRQLIDADKSAAKFLPEAVSQYIKDHQLYSN